MAVDGTGPAAVCMATTIGVAGILQSATPAVLQGVVTPQSQGTALPAAAAAPADAATITLV